MYQHILVPIDGSKTAEQGLREAIRLAVDQKARLRLLYVLDDFSMLVELSSVTSFDASLQKLRDYGQQLLSGAQKLASESGVQASPVLREIIEGRIANTVVDEARTSACDLIVMGTHGRRGFSRMALGSDADLVVRMSPVPVLLVRQNSRDGRAEASE
ncbi:universal stress protein [Rhodoferax sediminis]|jgi:nucleotide-binding universal stress UspA family protein|uniref:Universal stress protein n=1 Tax=Rhodoferax sediminis TaxID=2509614 RepID=A0A515D7V7_9BURK|nr:universal stress protein [Rhodoferax sediminis]QDL36500.1 universal stress protein [Rhodoferax sediminis]